MAGRPKGSKNKSTATIRAAALQLCPEMLCILAGMARSKKTAEAVRRECAIAVLQYGVGKPTEMHVHSGPEGGPIPVSVDVKQRIIAITERVRSRAATD